MKTLLQQITIRLEQAFEQAGYDKSYGRVTRSNRPDLCEYQCNGAMAAAKAYKKAPILVANDVLACLVDCDMFEQKEAVHPGFINLKVTGSVLCTHLKEMYVCEKLGVRQEEVPKTIVVDYGGPNVAKPLHVGHLRAAIIGESVKRLMRFKGNQVIGDIHLGDWGYQMGLIIAELERRQPNLPYFDEDFDGVYPAESPFTIAELEEIYPTASAFAKENEAFRENALEKTYLLQSGHKGYFAIWRHIMDVSVADLKKNYQDLNVEFDLWKGEADVQKYIPDMVEMLKEKGYAHLDEGALVVDVAQEGDKKEIPPCMILKSDGAALYSTTDLATLIERERKYSPAQVIYVVDKRQGLHFTQVFRCAKKAGIVPEATRLDFLGFGTMNGTDGKPFQTRAGGVMRLENLIHEINDEMLIKIKDNRTVTEEAALATAKMIGLAAVKYGDLSNQASKDYVFDVERFASFEGNTGPYILYTIVRIKSILNRFVKTEKSLEGLAFGFATTEHEKALMLEVVHFPEMIQDAYEDLAPHKICAYIYDLANALNKFYHETKILAEEDERKKEGYIALLLLVKEILEQAIWILGFEAPERM
ncbi:MAG: arginine--tRNA ligase [Lachnospiraceae bacterium]|nr:arginine--tRNA ligase [Lachnospiraceae bacterium]